MKRILSLVLAMCMMFTACSSEKSGIFKAGTYEGIAAGFGGDVTMSVTVDENKIVSIEAVSHSESAGISDPAFNNLVDDIITYQTVAVDAYAGCTFSSNAVLEAVKTALLAAGATEADITKAPDLSKDTAAKEYEADVVIIGAGGAGMTAALESLKAGASVLVLDKTASVGGNTIAAGSAVNAADEARQKNDTMSASELEKIEDMLTLEPKNDLMAKWQADVKADLDAYKANKETYLYDSASLHALQTYVGGDYVANPELIDVFTKGAVDAIGYLEDLGAKWNNDLTAAIGATWDRSHTPDISVWGPKGASFVLPQYEAAKELGVKVEFEHTVKEIIMEDGRAVGVKGVTADGAEFTAKANKGVIIATGGFGANVEMRQKYNKHWATLDESIRTTNVPSATGDGIVMAEAVGANLVGMEWIQMLTYPLGGSFSASINNIIYVDNNGNRVVREDGRRDEIAGAALEAPGAILSWITDQHEFERLGGKSTGGAAFEDQVAAGKMWKADTLEELGAQMGIDGAQLAKTVAEYNKAVESGEDALVRQLFGEKLDKAPYYGIKSTAMVHHTMGGIEINTNCEVLDTNGNVIPGLYAAGEVTGGIHGSNRLGGNAVADVLVFGQIAGQNAAK